MKKTLIISLIGSAIIIAYILVVDILFEQGFIARDNIAYRIDQQLLTPSIFVIAVMTGWNRSLLGDVPYYVFKILSFLIYFVVFYFAQVVLGKIKAKRLKR
ncbi:MAG: hypothetical protein FJ240_12570 [Nitrospira sp.]|nr:hypothetical protein [Nitrospira sp.]